MWWKLLPGYLVIGTTVCVKCVFHSRGDELHDKTYKNTFGHVFSIHAGMNCCTKRTQIHTQSVSHTCGDELHR